MGVPKFPKLKFLRLWGSITLCANFQLRQGLKKNCSLRWELFKSMSHVTFTRGNWGNSQLLMVGSQIDDLTPDLFFGHNFCFRCPNGSCELILNIYVRRDFQWYKELFNPLCVWPLKLLYESLGIHLDSNSQNGSSLGSVKVHSLTLFCTPKAWDVTIGLPLVLQPCKPLFWSWA
jgi:hypothetical protein